MLTGLERNDGLFLTYENAYHQFGQTIALLDPTSNTFSKPKKPWQFWLPDLTPKEVDLLSSLIEAIDSIQNDKGYHPSLNENTPRLINAPDYIGATAGLITRLFVANANGGWRVNSGFKEAMTMVASCMKDLAQWDKTTDNNHNGMVTVASIVVPFEA